MAARGIVGVGGKQPQVFTRFTVNLVDHAQLRVDEWSEFGQQQAPHRRKVALSLQHAREFGEVPQEPKNNRLAKVATEWVRKKDDALRIHWISGGFSLSEI